MNAADFTLTTNDIAEIMGVRPTSIVSAVSKSGSYHSLVPIRSFRYVINAYIHDQS